MTQPDTERRDRIAAAARTVRLRLGPNALAMAQRGEPIILNLGEADELADAVIAADQAHDAEVRAAAHAEAEKVVRARALHLEDGCDFCNGIDYAADQLRDYAAAAARPETEAHPAEHTWAAELYDPLADEWAPGTRYTDRDRAVNHLDHANTIGPNWRDGTPVQRRLVRATTTYTVEQPAAALPDDTTGA